MLRGKKYILIIAAAIIIKLFLFFYMSVFYPQGKFRPDSTSYLNTGMMLVSRGAFAQVNNGALEYELFRTPGYPLFLGVLHGIIKIPLDGVIFLQLLLTIITAFITYKACFEISSKGAFLSAMIVLFSPLITVTSLQVLTETLHLFLMSLFVMVFIRYLKRRDIKSAALSAVLLAAATYARPVSYYLCWGMPFFILYANIRDNLKKGIFHGAVFLAVICGILGIWQLRNYLHFGQNIFSNIQVDYKSIGIFHSYARNTDPLTKGWPPIPYYINAGWRCFISFMTAPGSLKYLHNPTLTVIGKAFGYSFVAFWMAGFLIGISSIRRNIYYRFVFCVILYFVVVTVAGQMWAGGERYRIPIIPCIAVISAAGWVKLKEWLSK